jgi:hypothetical protein
MVEVKMEAEVIKGIVGILKSLVDMDTYFIYSISLLQKYLTITMLLLFILALYTVYYVCQNSNRIKKLESKMNLIVK